MHSVIDRLLYPTALPPEINTTIGKNDKTLIPGFNRKSQRTASAARKYHWHIHQQRVIFGNAVTVVILFNRTDSWLYNRRHRVGIE